MQTVIIAAASRWRRDSLRAVLHAIDSESVILTTNTLDGLRQLAQTHAPAQIVLDSALAADYTPNIMNWLRLHAPACRVIVLTASASHNLTLNAAVAVLRWGFTTSELKLLIQPANSNTEGDISS